MPYHNLPINRTKSVYSFDSVANSMMESFTDKLESSPVGCWRLDNRLVSRHWGGRCDVIGRQVVGQGGCLGRISVGYTLFGYYGHPLGCRAFFLT